MLLENLVNCFSAIGTRAYGSFKNLGNTKVVSVVLNSLFSLGAFLKQGFNSLNDRITTNPPSIEKIQNYALSFFSKK